MFKSLIIQPNPWPQPMNRCLATHLAISLSQQSGQLVSLLEALPLSPQAPLDLVDQMARMAVQFAQCGPLVEGSGQCELSHGHYP